MADLKISELPVLDGADLDAVDEMALADLSASETRRIDTKKFLENGISRVIADGTIPGAKLVPDSVTSKEIGPDAVTASELADNAVDTAAIQDGAVTDPKVANGINGAKLTDDTVTASKIPASSLDRGLDKTSGAIGHTNAVAAATMSGITFDGQGHISNAVRLVGTDLPPATSADLGGVSVPAGSGLTVSGVGVLDHANNVTAGTMSGVTYDEHGHIVAAIPLAPGDIPIATETTVGGVSVPTGSALTVSAAGEIAHEDSPVAPGDYPKVTVNQKGHVTQGLPLLRADIPALDASILTTGTLDPNRVATQSITREKLANNSIAYIQEAQPDTNAIHHVGCLWYQESSAQLRLWNGNSWMPVGFGRLSEENLRFSGTFDATAGSVLDVTTFGIAAGLKPATPIPAATDALTGVYLVCKTAGTYAGDTYDNGDWVLCLGVAQGWVRIDTLSGGTGATIKIEDLLNVDVTTPNSGDTLIFDAITKKWVNRSTSAKKSAFVEAFDGTRTSFLLVDDATSASSLLISIGGIIQEPSVDFTFAGPRGVAFASAPPAGIEHWVVIEGVVSAGGGGGGTTLPPGTAAQEYLQWNATLSAWQPSTTLNGGSF